MKLYIPGKVPWHESQLIYHALADLGKESLVLVSPVSPYVCIGFHQDVNQEVDLEFCRENNIPVFRREVGGGAVYLDGDQFFFQLILRKDNPIIPYGREAFYQKFLQPAINVYKRIGIPVKYKPVNDIIAGTRKISGTGVGEIGECIVFVGNLILDFNYGMMSRVLKVPDEKFRDRMKKTIEDNLTTIRRELGHKESLKWDESSLNALMIKEFEKLTGEMEKADKDSELQARMDELAQRMMSDAWLNRKGRRFPGRSVRIRSGTSLVHNVHKAPGGLIRADFENSSDRFIDISISGDFFCYPEDVISRIESYLEGRNISDAREILAGFYKDQEIEIPGITIDDWMSVLRVV